MAAAILEWMLQAEMTEHLGYEKGERAVSDSGNVRNGSTQQIPWLRQRSKLNLGSSQAQDTTIVYFLASLVRRATPALLPGSMPMRPSPGSRLAVRILQTSIDITK